MDKLKFLHRLIAVMFMAVALTACSSSSKDDDDDDDDDEKTEKVSKKKHKVDSESSVDGFCSLIDEMTEEIGQATDENDMEALQEKFKNRMKRYREDETPLSDQEKEQVLSSLALFGGTVIDKSAELSGEVVSEEELYDAGVEFGQQIRSIVMQSSTIAEVCQNLREAGM